MIARHQQFQSLPIGTAIEFEIERPVASLKNRRRIFRGKGGRGLVSLPSKQAEVDTAMIVRAAQVAAGGRAFGPDDALRLDFSHHLASGVVRVRVEKIGELAARGARGTGRDCHGMVETIADALQDVLYPDDRQVDAFSGRRVRT